MDLEGWPGGRSWLGTGGMLSFKVSGSTLLASNSLATSCPHAQACEKGYGRSYMDYPRCVQVSPEHPALPKEKKRKKLQ